MNLFKDDISKASKQIGLTDFQAENLWQALQTTQADKPKSNLLKALLYVGAIVTIVPMTLFYFEDVSDQILLVLALCSGLISLSAGCYFWHVKKWKTPGGTLCSLALMTVPLSVHSLQSMLNWWPFRLPDSVVDNSGWISNDCIPLGITFVVAACLIFYFIRYPFLTALIYYGSWLLCLNFTNILVGQKIICFDSDNFVSVIIGAVLISFGFYLYRKNQKSFGFWSYLLGMLSCWIGLTFSEMQNEWIYLAYCLVNVAFLLLSGFFHRKIFMAFGSFGVIYYIGHVTCLFSNSVVFPFILAAIGFSIILTATFLLGSRKKISANKA